MFERDADLLPLAKRFVWRLRDDVRKGQSAGLQPAPASFDHWWLVRGRSEYPAWATLTSADLTKMSEPRGSIKLGTAELPVQQALAMVLQFRPDVVEKFTVNGQLDVLAVAGWFYAIGIREHLLQSLVDDQLLRLLDKPLPLDDERGVDAVPAVTLFMRIVWHMLDVSLQKAMPLTNALTRERFIGWFFVVAAPTFELQSMLASRWRHWLLQEVVVPAQAPSVLPRFALLTHGLSSDLAARHDLSTDAGVKKLQAWAEQAQKDKGPWHWLRLGKAAAPQEVAYSTPLPLTQHPFGVNLYGFAYGELGIGEDLRMAVEACESAGIPYRIVNIDAGKDLRQADDVLKQQVDRSGVQAPYAFNVFCVPGFDMVSRVFLRMGPQLLRSHINIGWWPWELPVWPKAWNEAFDLVDELWTGSEFTGATYKKSTDKPVQLMPLPVSVDRGRSQPRSAFGLPAGLFLFLFIFDFNSHLARKNPDAILSAFEQAFDKTQTDVGLVLKVMNVRKKDPLWLAFLKRCSKDKRIKLITETMDRQDVLGLVDACDAYVSLHRAEGFGRTLAEAMLYGKPVIATAYSGNADFMHPQWSFPVSYEEVPVKAGEYPFVEAVDAPTWAEPSVSDAARQMVLARQRAQQAGFSDGVKAFAQQQFSIARIGELMKTRLQALATLHRIPVN
ncbi:glycosyltransferase [Limnohabitans sp. DM1]|uniref:glycosyltransferase n=1 Tax=Limnohabitans sp. DM1 TaxID=1597955 RepID=UPI000A494659|nr:glycosyltransferase [Limnohabitans sp. DM1]